jgi:hypothetical protein
VVQGYHENKFCSMIRSARERVLLFFWNFVVFLTKPVGRIILIAVLSIILAVSATMNFFWWRENQMQHQEIRTQQEEIDQLRQRIDEMTTAAQADEQASENNNDGDTADTTDRSDQNNEQIIAALKDQTAKLYGRDFQRDVPVNFLTPAELEEHYLQIMEKEESQEELEIAEQELKLFGLITADYDLYQGYMDVLTEQVVGLYDTEAEKLFIVGDARLDFMNRMILVHELTHVLQDQYYDLDAIDERLRDNDDAYTAYSAVIEGEATLVMQDYITEHATLWNLAGALLQSGSMDSSQLEAAPRYLQDSLMFPYDQGLAFVTALREQTGESYPDLYTYLPASTKQIVHPEKYLAREEPTLVTLEDQTTALGPDWELVDDSVMGEYGWQVIVDEYLGEDEAAEAAAGWGGDRYHFYRNEVSEEVRFEAMTVWDTQSDAEEFAAALRDYADQLAGAALQIDQDGTSVSVVVE